METIDKLYFDFIRNTSPKTFHSIQHKQINAYPTGIIVLSSEPIEELFKFTLCPLHIIIGQAKEIPGKNPHDIIIFYKREYGSLEKYLYILCERYRKECCEKTEISMKRYIYEKKMPPRKIIIPCYGRINNLIPVLERFNRIDLPSEGYRPQILLVEHSPIPEMESVALKYNCEWIWLFLNPGMPLFPMGQFNKALAFDKGFLFGSPASWYLFHDNDILVPKEFWKLLDENIKNTGARFIQPYTNRCLYNLLQEVSEEYRLHPEYIERTLSEDEYFPLSPGAPGGSLYIHRDRYIEVGGHDPHISWGYAAEDLLFFKKLQLFDKISYADDPPIPMLHLWHPPAANNNPLYPLMDLFVKVIFERIDDEMKKEICKEKSEILKSSLPNRDIELH